LADELDKRQHQLRNRALHLVGIGVPAQGRSRRRHALELLAEILELGDLADCQAAAPGDDLGGAGKPFLRLGLDALSRHQTFNGWWMVDGGQP
jgi:hypothetical protein